MEGIVNSKDFDKNYKNYLEGILGNLDKNDAVKQRLLKIFDDAFEHDGFSDFHVEIKILKRQQKEVIIHYGKQYRFVLDFMNSHTSSNSNKHHSISNKFAGVDS